MYERNTISFDWLSFTYKSNDLHKLFRILGIRQDNFPNKNSDDTCVFARTKGFKGYKIAYRFEGITICVGSDRDDIWVEFSGSGCRTYENNFNGNYNELFTYMLENSSMFHFARLDVAYDDYDYALDIDLIHDEIHHHNCVSCFRSVEITYDPWNGGETIYLGSSQSDVRMRIYDKLFEQKKKHKDVSDLIKHWVRWEVQLRNDRAFSFVIAYISNNYNIGETFGGVLNNYIRFVNRSEGRIYEDEISQWWSDFIGTLKRIKLFFKPFKNYNITHVLGNCVNLYGNCIDACIQAFGVEEFVRSVKNRDIKRNPKYDIAVDDYFTYCANHGIGIPL